MKPKRLSKRIKKFKFWRESKKLLKEYLKVTKVGKESYGK
jgi:hypothetical protein